MKKFIYIMVLLVGFGCKQSKSQLDNATESVSIINADFIENFENDFLSSVAVADLKKPCLITSRSFNTFNILSKDQSKALNINQIFRKHDTISKFGIALDVRFNNDFKSFVVYQFDEDQKMLYKLVNYTNKYQFIDAIDVSYYDLTTQMNQTETYVYNNKLFVHDKQLNKATHYYLKPNGIFEKQSDSITFNYLPLIDYQTLDHFKANFEQRIVKAKDGLIIKDSLGNNVGNYEYLETVSVIDYTADKTKIIDNGQIIYSRNAKVIINPKALKKDQNFYIDKANIGYVPEAYFFKPYSDDGNHYNYDGLTIKKNALHPIALNELFDVKQVNINDYKNRVLYQPNSIDVTKLYKKDKVLTLLAKNGKKVVYKDTTYNSEFSPTKTYSVTKNPGFNDMFLVHYHMVFDYQRFDFISQSTGELLGQYAGGYPYVSPKKDMVVSIDYDTECPSQRTLFIDKIVDDKIIKTFELYYNLEENYDHITFEKTSDDLELYWLSNTEFIVKFWGASECYSDSDNYFYYKYKIKQQFLEMLEGI
ncbi:MAG: hypothetical protein ACI9NI_002034 [Olleya marilimosa]|jgi:hypothetical protein